MEYAPLGQVHISSYSIRLTLVAVIGFFVIAEDFALIVAALPAKETPHSRAAINKFFFMGLNWWKGKE